MFTKEVWEKVTFLDIKRDAYEVSNTGKITRIKDNKYLKGNNPKNEKGYVRMSLLNINGKTKKYPLHRIVAFTFIGNSELEVNHKNGNKLNNDVENLEYTTRKANAHHASVNGLYESAENHWKTNLTNTDVHTICQMFSEGASTRDIIHDLNLENSHNTIKILSNIRNRKTWTSISQFYNWDTESLKYRTYDIDDIKEMIIMLLKENYRISEVVAKFDRYEPKKLRNVLKKVIQGKLYKSIVNEIMSSTTIEKVS